MDGSKSISETQFESMHKFMESVVNNSTVGKNQTRFGLILYSTDIKSVFTLNTYDTKRDIVAAIKRVKPLDQDTHTGEAMQFSLEFFDAKHGGRKASKVPQILMVITDGEATNPYILKPSSDALRNNGVTILSIGVKGANEEELKIMAGGDTSRVFKVDSFKALETLYKNISSVLCNSTKPGKSASCVVGGSEQGH